MSRAPRRRSAAALALAVGLVAAACGDDDAEESTATTAAAEATTTAATEPTTTAAAGTTTAPAGGGAATTDLSSVCPNPLIVQTDWFPEPEHGGLYQLIGTEGTTDPNAGTYTGPLLDTGIDLEIRAGGPFLGNQTTGAQMYAEPDIFMGYIATNEAITKSGEQPLVAVVSPLEKSPQILMWDPEAFPDIETFADIGESGAPVLYFEGSSYMDFLIGKGFLTRDQIDASYDGSPARFVTEQVFQQGFASNEPYKYENDIDEWQKPVEYLLIHEAGFEIYPSSLSVRPERITEDADCLAGVVPLMQQAQVDYMADPQPINDFFLDYVEELASFWTLSAEGNANAVEVMLSEGLVGNGPDDTIGNFDMDRVQKLIDETVPIFESEGVDSMKDGVTAEDVVTNEFIDDTIGMP